MVKVELKLSVFAEVVARHELAKQLPLLPVLLIKIQESPLGANKATSVPARQLPLRFKFTVMSLGVDTVPVSGTVIDETPGAFMPGQPAAEGLGMAEVEE